LQEGIQYCSQRLRRLLYLLTQPSYANLNAVGGWVYVTGGVRGIIIYKKNSSEFAAYERCCPYDPNVSTARVEVIPATSLVLTGHAEVNSTCLTIPF